LSNFNFIEDLQEQDKEWFALEPFDDKVTGALSTKETLVGVS
jgi:hypothetical protein